MLLKQFSPFHGTSAVDWICFLNRLHSRHVCQNKKPVILHTRFLAGLSSFQGAGRVTRYGSKIFNNEADIVLQACVKEWSKATINSVRASKFHLFGRAPRLKPGGKIWNEECSRARLEYYLRCKLAGSQAILTQGGGLCLPWIQLVRTCISKPWFSNFMPSEVGIYSKAVLPPLPKGAIVLL